MYELVRVGYDKLVGEIIKLDANSAFIQCYEDTCNWFFIQLDLLLVILLKELNHLFLLNLVQVFWIKSLTEFKDHSRLLLNNVNQFLFQEELMQRLLMERNYGHLFQKTLNKEIFYLKEISLVVLMRIVCSQTIKLWFHQNLKVESHILLQLETTISTKRFLNFNLMESKLNTL